MKIAPPCEAHHFARGFGFCHALLRRAARAHVARREIEHAGAVSGSAMRISVPPQVCSISSGCAAMARTSRLIDRDPNAARSAGAFQNVDQNDSGDEAADVREECRAASLAVDSAMLPNPLKNCTANQ